MIYTLRLPKDVDGWKPEPFPGTVLAFEEGCTCPEDQPDWPELLLLDDACPVHELERVTQ